MRGKNRQEGKESKDAIKATAEEGYTRFNNGKHCWTDNFTGGIYWNEKMEKGVWSVSIFLIFLHCNNENYAVFLHIKALSAASEFYPHFFLLSLH